MRQYLLCFALCLAATNVSFASEDSAYIVTCKANADIEALVAEFGRARGLRANHVYHRAMHGFASQMDAATLAALRADPRVLAIEADAEVHLPPFRIERIESPRAARTGASATAVTQVIPTGIARIGAVGAAAPANVAVAVIDTGIASAHPELNVVGGKSFVIGKGWADDNGHGSHVAGIIGARNNTVGAVGVAPGIPLYAVKVLNSKGSGSYSAIIAGIDWCIETNTAGAKIRVINMSLGGPGFSVSFDAAVNRARNAGIIVVVAAGNEAADASTSQPAAFANVIAVSAIADSDGLAGAHGAVTTYGGDDTFASFSNFGAAVDIAAPGVSIYSTYKGTSYAVLSGTSMAAPHVAGVCALAAGFNPPAATANSTWVDLIRSIVITGATPQASPDGFTGDRDTSPEPLLNASAAAPKSSG